MKKILSIFISITLILSMTSIAFAANSTEILNSENVSDVIDPTSKIVDLDLQNMVLGEIMITEQPLLSKTGEEIGKMTISVKKVKEAPQTFSSNYEDFYKTDGSFIIDVDVTGKFPPLLIRMQNIRR